jgi:hypothetical protein
VKSYKIRERNHLLTIPYAICFQAVKVGDDLMCVYSVGLFQFKECFGFSKQATICQFVGSLSRSLGFVGLGFVSEEELDEGEEVLF